MLNTNARLLSRLMLVHPKRSMLSANSRLVACMIEPAFFEALIIRVQMLVSIAGFGAPNAARGAAMGHGLPVS